MENEITTLKLRFGKDDHTIDAETLISILFQFTSLIQEVNKAIAEDSKKIKIEVKAVEEGSFVVALAIIAQTIIERAREVFTKENVTYIESLMAIIGVKGVFGIYKFLKGEKPKSIENVSPTEVKIENNSGAVTVVDLRGANLYLTNDQIKNIMGKTFEKLNEDSDIESFGLITDSVDNELSFNKEEILTITENVNKKEAEYKIILIEKAPLSITGLNFDLAKKWKFIFKGNPISAYIKDLTFPARVDKGENFAKGDHLIVDLEIKQRFEQAVNDYINTDYTVLRIIDHIDRVRQSKLNI